MLNEETFGHCLSWALIGHGWALPLFQTPAHGCVSKLVNPSCGELHNPELNAGLGNFAEGAYGFL